MEPSCMAAGVAVAITVMLVLSLIAGLLWNNGREQPRAVAYRHVCRRYEPDDDETAEGYDTQSKTAPGALLAKKDGKVDKKSTQALKQAVDRAEKKRNEKKPRLETSGYTPVPAETKKQKQVEIKPITVGRLH